MLDPRQKQHSLRMVMLSGMTAFVLVRAILGTVHAGVVDRPNLNGPGLVDELTRLVVRFLAP